MINAITDEFRGIVSATNYQFPVQPAATVQDKANLLASLYKGTGGTKERIVIRDNTPVLERLNPYVSADWQEHHRFV